MLRLFVLINTMLSGLFLLSQTMPQLQNAVNTLDKDVHLRSAGWSISVIDLKNGESVLSHNGEMSLATASTMKAVSTAASLAVLGPDFQFETTIEYDGSLEGTHLKGNLYIKGEGDPSLGSHRFDKKYRLAQMMIAWGEIIKAAGIQTIEGRIIGDASFLGTQMIPNDWSWDDISNYYGAGPSGLNIHENFYRLDFHSGSSGTHTDILRTEPSIPNLVFHNEVIARGSSDNAYIYGAPYSYDCYVRGTIPPNRSVFSIKGAIPDPAWFTAWSLEQELKRCGISVLQPASTVRLLKLAGIKQNPRREILYVHKSPPLRQLVRETNMESLNLYAEALLLRSAKARQKGQSTAQATDWLQSFWKEQGVNVRGMNLTDGSGLSPSNAMSTQQMARILYLSSRQPYGSVLRESFPMAGRSGSLKSMLKGTAAEGRLRAKSGYISGARGYTGYVETQNGRQLAFAMLANRYSCSAGAMRRKFESLMVKLAEGR